MNKAFFVFFWVSIITAAVISFADDGYRLRLDVEKENAAYEENWHGFILSKIEENSDVVLQSVEGEKIYIKPERVSVNEDGLYLRVRGDEMLYIPSLRSDAKGCYLDRFIQPSGYWDPPKGLKPDEIEKREKDRVKRNKEAYERGKEYTRKQAEERKRNKDNAKKHK